MTEQKPVTEAMVEDYQRDGVVLVKGLFAPFVNILRAGVERNMAEPDPYGSDNVKAGEGGRFFDVWRRTDREGGRSHRSRCGVTLRVFEKRPRSPVMPL